jgi:hypothetical protein
MKLLVDECLSEELTKLAQRRGHAEASHVAWIGKRGWKDWQLRKVIIDSDWTFVTSMAELPSGFSQRLHRRLEANMPTTRRNFFGWAVALAGSVVAVGGIELSGASHQVPDSISKHSQHLAKPIPPDMQVVVSEKGKLFHLAACPFIINRETIRHMTASVALAQGLSPCTRCLSKYL